MNVRAVLFDMDGVLIDSEAVMLRAAMDALREFGIETVPADFEPFVGAGEERYLGGPAEKYGFSYQPEYKARAYALYGACVRTDAKVPGDVLSTLQYLKKKGYRLAVGSSADRIKVEYNLAALELPADFFDELVTGSDVKRKKPFPDVYLYAAEALQVSPADCVVVEDALNGIRAAQNAGMHTIAITSTFPREQLEEVSPEEVIDHLGELKNLL